MPTMATAMVVAHWDRAALASRYSAVMRWEKASSRRRDWTSSSSICPSW